MSYPLKKLGNIAKVFAGSSAPQEKKFFQSGTFPFVRTGDLGKYGRTKNLVKVADYLNNLCLKEKHLIFAKKGTILFPKSGASILSNHRGILGMDAYFVSHLAGVDSGNEITNKYIYNYLLSVDLVDYCENPSYPSLKLSRVKEIIIPFPPLPIQKAIVQKLDAAFEKIDASIELAHKNLENIEEFRKSVMEETFNDGKIFIFEEICNKVTDGSHNPPKGVESGIPMISSRNLDDNDSITFDNIRFIDDENYIRENKRTDVEDGDILLSIVGTIGKVAVVKSEYGKFVMQRSLAVLKLRHELVNSFYMYYYLKSDRTQKALVNGANGAAQKGIYLRDIKKIKIPLPPLEKQKEIVEYLDGIFAKNTELKEMYEKKLKDLKEMKQSLLKEAFEGRLVSE